MSGLFRKPSVPTVVTQPPKKTDAEIAKAAADARQRLRGQRGRQSTILTSGMGVMDTATTQGKTLLGA